MIAALFVDVDGIYARPGVDVWDVSRDARLYAGPYSVVAHPPCERWSRLAHIWAAVPGYPGIGQDDGCFAAALAAVEKWGGVLEHPLGSAAWPAFGLPRAPHGGGWARALFRPGWACQVEQGHYGHPAPKPTLLYYVGAEPPPLHWGPSAAKGRIELMSSTDARRRQTPPAFADLLLGLASSANKTPRSV